MKKKLLPFLMVLLATLVALPSFAQTYTCSGPPILTGNAGVVTGPPSSSVYIAGATPWSGPPAKPYSMAVITSAATVTEVSFAAQSGAIYRITGCTSGPSGCSTPPAGRITSLKLETRFDYDPAHTLVATTSVIVNGTKAAEVFGLGNIGSLQNTQTWSDGVSFIHQDTGSNSRVYFEGWNTVSGVTTWKSVAAKFFSNTCGSIALNSQPRRDALASVGLELMPSSVVPKQWWMT
jgi:hypothetical protein